MLYYRHKEGVGRSIHLYMISLNPPIPVSFSALGQRCLQIHRQDPRPNPDLRAVLHSIADASRRVSLSLHSQCPFDAIPLFLLSLEPSVLLSRRPSQRPQRRPNPVTLQLRPCLPRPVLPVHRRVHRLPAKPLFKVPDVRLDLLFFRKGRVLHIIQEQKSADVRQRPLRSKLHVAARLAPLDRPDVGTIKTHDPVRDAVDLPFVHLPLLGQDRLRGADLVLDCLLDPLPPSLR